MRRLFILLSSGLVLTIALPMMASRGFADPVVQLALTGVSGDSVTVTTPPPSSVSEGTIAGPYNYTISGPNTSTIPNGPYLGFCIQFNQNITFDGPHPFTVETLATDVGQTKADQILRLLYDYTQTKTGGTLALPSGPLGNPASPATFNYVSDALTVAIWDVLQATNNDVNGHLSIGGTNQISASSWGNTGRGTDANTLASQWLKELTYNVDPTNLSLYDASKVAAFYNHDLQDQSVVLGFSPFVTPEPSRSTALAGMALLLGMTFGGRAFLVRRRRQDAA